MDWDTASISAGPPRYEWESDDEDDARVLEHKSCDLRVYLEGNPAWMQRDLVVLLGDVGTAIMLAAQRDFTQTACVACDKLGHLASIHIPEDIAMPCVVFIPLPDNLPRAIPSGIAQCVIQRMQPSCVTIVQSYVPALYLTRESSNTNAVHESLRYLCNVPADRRPSGWQSLDRWSKPWEAPNIFTGCGAAFFMLATYARIPAQMLCVPIKRAASHANYQQLKYPIILTHGKESVPRSELRRRLATLIDDVDEPHLACILPLLGNRPEACQGHSSLLAHALLASLAKRASSESIGEGGMYV